MPTAGRRRMVARDPGEAHRASTPLELLFDLVFVVAVGSASVQLHHLLAEGRVAEGLVAYLTVFFAVWWAWMGFTWFATAYDVDDWPYRVLVVVQMAGALVVASGVQAAMTTGNFTAMTFGYVLVRAAVVPQWLRAAAADPLRRRTALFHAIGIVVVQVLWLLRLLLPGGLALPSFLVLVAAELAVPVLAQRAQPLTWHPQHIAERYGLFTLIILGEGVLGSGNALFDALNAEEGHGLRLWVLAGSALVVLAALWWVYFDTEQHGALTSLRTALRWGYGHYLVFAAAGAFTGGVELALQIAAGHEETHVSGLVASASVTVPVAVFLLAVWLLALRPRRDRVLDAAFPAAVAALLLCSLVPAPSQVTAAAVVCLVLTAVLTSRPAREPEPVDS